MERPELEKILVLLQESRTAKEDAHTYFIQAFECLVHAYTNRVIAQCHVRGVVKGDTQDIAQEIFISIYKSLSGFHGDSTVGLHKWIFTIINNRITDYFRKHPKREQPAELHELSSHQTPEVERQIIARNEGKMAMLAFTRLSEQDQLIIRLKFLDKLSSRESAAILGIKTPGSFRTKLKRAMDRWRQARESLEEEGGKNVC